MAPIERLSAQDTSFLHAERPNLQTHVGSMLILEPKALDTPFDDVVAHVESRIHRLPRFRKKLHWPCGMLGRPVWADDADFDLCRHVRHLELPEAATDEALCDVLAQLQESILDRHKPLWELWVADFDDTRVLMQKTHHALADGVSGVDILSALLDVTPDKPRKPPREWTPEPAPSPAARLLQRLPAPRPHWPHLPKPADTIRAARGLAGALPSLFARAPETSLTVRLGTSRRYDFARVDMEVVKEIKDAFGVKVNDVVLAAVAAGLGDLLRSRGEAYDDLALRVMVPVNVRREEEHGNLGNLVSFMLVDLPVGPMQAADRLRRIAGRTSELKRSGASTFMTSLGWFLERVPEVAVMAYGVAAQSQHMLNLVVTNVPGAPFPVYFMGAEVREAFPYVPATANSAVNVAMGSYNGMLRFGITGDRETTPDLHVLVEGIERAVTELRPSLIPALGADGQHVGQ